MSVVTVIVIVIGSCVALVGRLESGLVSGISFVLGSVTLSKEFRFHELCRCGQGVPPWRL